MFTGRATLPDTLADRCLPIRLRRRRRGETIEPFRRRDALPKLATLRERIAAVVDGSRIEVLAAARPDVPAELEDRQADLWEPLLAIADEAGGDWPRRARSAAVAIHADGAVASETEGVAMLRDCARIFVEAGVAKLPTRELGRRLVDLDDASGPWAEDWSRLVSDANWKAIGWRIRRLLRPFGIESTKIRLPDGSTAQGYRVGDFVDPIERYALAHAHTPPENRTTEPNPSDTPDYLRDSVVPLRRGEGVTGRSDVEPLTLDEEAARLRLVAETLGATPIEEGDG
jgi:hypothetical protein